MFLYFLMFHNIKCTNYPQYINNDLLVKFGRTFR